MAGSGITGWKRGWTSGETSGAGTTTEDCGARLERGYGTPTHVSPPGTIYVKLDATMGTSSHFRTTTAGTWQSLSDG